MNDRLPAMTPKQDFVICYFFNVPMKKKEKIQEKYNFDKSVKMFYNVIPV